MAAFRDRSLARIPFPYVFLHATYCKARVNHRVVYQAAVVATEVAADGHREVLCFDVGNGEDGAFRIASCGPESPWPGVTYSWSSQALAPG
jgi:putative transposase